MDNNIQDLIIIGGGISGLYTLYKIVKNKINCKSITLYEKNDYFGGRIYSFFVKKNNHNFKFEAGAARFCKEKHIFFYKLINDLKLNKYLTLGSAQIQFIPYTNNYLKKSELLKKSPYDFINKVIKKSNAYSYNTLIKYTFIQFVKKYKLLKKDEIKYLNDSFGYSGEINSMNAFNAIHMFKSDLNKKYHYYSLKCGLSELVNHMIKYIKKHGKNYNIQILNQMEVKNIITTHEKDDSTYTCIINDIKKKIYEVNCKKVVCALQKSTLLKYNIFKPIYKELNSVEAKALCRIYMIFKVGPKGVWFKDYGKITTNNENRYMIPLDKKHGSIMISYTDSNYATYLNNYYQKYGIKKLESFILSHWEQVLKIKIPKPLYTKVCYWNEGIAMWKAGIDSKMVSKKMLKPFSKEELYIVGENYSLNQAWIEGGLQTVEKIIKKLKI